MFGPFSARCFPLILLTAFGFTLAPIDSNGSAEGRPVNRRAEIVPTGSEAQSQAPTALTQVGAVIGFVEIDDLGRFDVNGAPAGTTRQDALMAPQNRRPMGAWIEGQNRFVIVAHPAPGNANQGWIHIEIQLATKVGSTTSDLQPGVGETVISNQTRGIVYQEPGPPAVQRSLYSDDMTVEEVSQSSDGLWNLRLRFEGLAVRYSEGTKLGEVPMSGVLEFQGMPVVGP